MSGDSLKEFRERANQADEMIRKLEAQLQQLQAHTSLSQYEDTLSAGQTGHPKWYKPYGPDAETAGKRQLMVYNSLTGEKHIPFVPKDGRTVKWYGCGPTVYDDAHLGHARAYVTFDIIRRILQDYFQYDVYYVQNITDVDDKIILRARRSYLLDQYRQEKPDRDQVVSDGRAAYEALKQTKQKSIDKKGATLRETKAGKDPNPKHIEEQVMELNEAKLKLKIADKELAAFEAVVADAGSTAEQLIGVGTDAIREWLDAAKGSSVNDPKIFEQHARKYEARFFEDMRNLNVLDPDAIPRVTEYIEKIVEYVERIVANGLAYVSEGSVYFDIMAFRQKHDYGKLSPQSVGNLQALESGEGALDVGSGEKRCPYDFALWKASKPGEPQWESPWGKGRPGWHIECSCMASDLIGDNMDIHTGGEDLKFPHHDNECAQSEAYYGCQQWVNYYFHAGHLNIQGLKMSKSLKNFWTIRDMLSKLTSREMRLLFLLQNWYGKINYNDESLAEAQKFEDGFRTFFGRSRQYIRSNFVTSDSYQKWNDADRKVNAEIMKTQHDVDAALLDNFDYTTATRRLRDLGQAMNTYRDNQKGAKALLLRKAGAYINKILTIFGVIDAHHTGFSLHNLDIEIAITPFVDLLVDYRNAAKEWGMSQKGDGAAMKSEFGKRIQEQFAVSQDDEKESGATQGEKLLAELRTVALNFDDAVQSSEGGASVLQECDMLRDAILPPIGIRLQDTGSDVSVWNLDSASDMALEAQRGLADASQKQIVKIQNKLKNREKDLRQWEEKSLTVEQYYEATYQPFERPGKPTHLKDGTELSKGQKKKLGKLEKQLKKKHASYQKALAANPNFLQELRDSVTQLRNELAALGAKSE